MNRIHHILVPTDFGDAASAALEYAIDLAERFSAEITLLHVAPFVIPTYAGGLYWPTDDLRSDAEKAVKAAVSAARQRWQRVTAEVTEGHPGEEIVRVAERRGVDLVVMGTHGRRGLRRLALGSVAEHVVRYADVPVLTVRAPAKPAAAVEQGSSEGAPAQ